MKRSARTRRAGVPATLPAAAAHPAALPLHLAEDGERIARGRDVLALRRSCAALDLQGALVLAGGSGRIQDAIGELDQILGDLREQVGFLSA
jgi:hypothetical protein